MPHAAHASALLNAVLFQGRSSTMMASPGSSVAADKTTQLPPPLSKAVSNESEIRAASDWPAVKRSTTTSTSCGHSAGSGSVSPERLIARPAMIARTKPSSRNSPTRSVSCSAASAAREKPIM